MRHGKKIIKLGIKSAHRKSMLANMAVSLFEHKRITTTSTKAKALIVIKAKVSNSDLRSFFTVLDTISDILDSEKRNL